MWRGRGLGRFPENERAGGGRANRNGSRRVSSADPQRGRSIARATVLSLHFWLADLMVMIPLSLLRTLQRRISVLLTAPKVLARPHGSHLIAKGQYEMGRMRDVGDARIADRKDSRSNERAVAEPQY